MKAPEAPSKLIDVVHGLIEVLLQLQLLLLRIEHPHSIILVKLVLQEILFEFLQVFSDLPDHEILWTVLFTAMIPA